MALASFDMPKLRTKSFYPEKCVLSYDKNGDILTISQWPGRPATSVDIGGEFWVRADPSTGEVLGFEIEGFQHLFLKNHPELSALWGHSPELEFAQQSARILLKELADKGITSS